MNGRRSLPPYARPPGRIRRHCQGPHGVRALFRGRDTRRPHRRPRLAIPGAHGARPDHRDHARSPGARARGRRSGVARTRCPGPGGDDRDPAPGIGPRKPPRSPPRPRRYGNRSLPPRHGRTPQEERSATPSAFGNYEDTVRQIAGIPAEDVGGPRVRRVTGASPTTTETAYYFESWRRKVQRVGQLNYPEAARTARLYGSLRLLGRHRRRRRPGGRACARFLRASRARRGGGSHRTPRRAVRAVPARHAQEHRRPGDRADLAVPQEPRRVPAAIGAGGHGPPSAEWPGSAGAGFDV